jgi:hypothetical protein
MLIGADWKRETVLGLLEKNDIKIAGTLAKSMGHGLAVYDDGWIFIKTKDPANE